MQSDIFTDDLQYMRLRKLPNAYYELERAQTPYMEVSVS